MGWKMVAKRAAISVFSGHVGELRKRPRSSVPLLAQVVSFGKELAAENHAAPECLRDVCVISNAKG